MSEQGANRLIDIDDLKDYLKIMTDDDNTLLETIVNYASSTFEMFCGRKFKNVTGAGVAATITEYHDGIGNKLFLNYYPIIAVASIYDDSDRVFGADTLVAATDYIIKTNSGIIELAYNGSFCGGPMGVKVSYTGGYTTNIPYEVILATCEIGGLLYKEKDHLGMASKSFSDGSAAWFSDKLSMWTKEAIMKYSNKIMAG